MAGKQSNSLESMMSSAQKGDKQAYETLLKEISSMLKGYLYKNISNKAEVEDVLQEILLSIHKARHTYDSSRPLMPWVMSIAKFRFKDYLRRHYRTTAKETVDIADVEEKLSSENVTDSNETSELLRKALDNLPDRQRVIVEMMKIEGFTAKEVGKKMNMSVSAVKVAAHRAYKKLKVELKSMGYED